MNRNQKTTKRQRAPPKNNSKRQKMSCTNIEKAKEIDLLNIPLTATTVNVLNKKLMKLEEDILSASLKKESQTFVKCHSKGKTVDIACGPIKEQSELSNLFSYDLQECSQKPRGNRQQDVNGGTVGNNVHFNRVRSTYSSTSTLNKSEPANISKMEKYSPKNIKSPSATCKLNCSKSKRVLNKNNVKPENQIPDCSSFSTSQLEEYSPKNFELPCSHNVYLKTHCHKIKNDGYKGQPVKSNVISASSIDLSRIATEKRKCDKCGDEEMLLFFWRMLPATAALNEEKKSKFKTVMVSTLKQLLDE